MGKDKRPPEFTTKQVIPPPPTVCPGILVEVRPGDTLFLIAQRFGVSLTAIIQANPQIPNPRLIFPGQVVCVPLPRPAGFTTGPLAADPQTQRFIGVIVENTTPGDRNASIRLFNKDTCPRTVGEVADVTVPPNCIFQSAFDLPGFFYEVEVVVPDVTGIRVAVYGLTEAFNVIAGNTLRHAELTLLPEPSTPEDRVERRQPRRVTSGWTVHSKK